MNKLSYVSLDVETGGLDEEKHSLLEIGMVAVIDNQVKEELSLKVRHDEYNATEIALKVNGINLLEHDKVAISKEEVVEIIKDFAQRYHVEEDGKIKKLMPLGCNIQFDVRFMRKLFKSVGEEWEKYFDHHNIDIYSIMVGLYVTKILDEYPPRNTMAWRYLGIPEEEKPHIAINGARYNLIMLDAIKKKVDITLLTQFAGVKVNSKKY